MDAEKTVYVDHNLLFSVESAQYLFFDFPAFKSVYRCFRGYFLFPSFFHMRELGDFKCFLFTRRRFIQKRKKYQSLFDDSDVGIEFCRDCLAVLQ